jgi:hypothetical protein
MLDKKVLTFRVLNNSGYLLTTHKCVWFLLSYEILIDKSNLYENRVIILLGIAFSVKMIQTELPKFILLPIPVDLFLFYFYKPSYKVMCLEQGH